jgi:hypothetical protein
VLLTITETIFWKQVILTWIKKENFIREGVGGRGRNDPNVVCTYEWNKILKKGKFHNDEREGNLLKYKIQINGFNNRP